MSVQREGGCSCGEIRYRLASDPLFTHCCHCLNCQRQTGSAFVVNLLIETDRVELLAGEPQRVDVPRSGSRKQRIFRCPACWTAVYSQYTRAGVRFVRAGTLDDPSDITPDVHIYTRSKLSWLALPAETPAFATTTTRTLFGPPRVSSASGRSGVGEHADSPSSRQRRLRA